MGPGGLNVGKMMKQAQDMQRKIGELQEELKERVVEASSGGGMVTAMANGNSELVSIRTDREVIDPDDSEVLEDMVTSAVNDVLKKAKELNEAEMQKITGNIGMGGLF